MGKRKRPKEQTTRTAKDTYIYTYVYITRRAGRRAVLGVDGDDFFTGIELGVGPGVCDGVGLGVGDGIGDDVGLRLERGVGDSVGDGVKPRIRFRVGGAFWAQCTV